jgi:hypothetical protein
MRAGMVKLEALQHQLQPSRDLEHGIAYYAIGSQEDDIHQLRPERDGDCSEQSERRKW